MVSVLAASVLLALDLGAPHAHAVRTTHAPTIDGHLDDDAWKAATPTDAFTQNYPEEGKPPSEHTTMRVLYDDEALYVGFELEQVHGPIFGRLTRRDRDSESEWISLQIDTRNDGKAVYTFGVNVVGVVVDAIVSEPSNWNFDWDEVWEARTSLTPTGWAAELKIPLRVLRFDATAPVQSWGLQAIRYIAHLQEFDQWSFIHRDVANPLTRFGRLDDLEGLKAGGAFELRPFVTARASHLDATDETSASGFALGASAGLDLKWHIAQDLTLDAAALPDFAQVEADQLILNLSNFETFLPEKRPLFLEGTEVFSFPLQIFYSRRIGNAPTAPTLSDNTTLKLVNVPSPAQIYGAGKLVGHLGPHWTVGALTALTGRNEVTTEDTTNGMRATRLAAPLRASEVLRLKREWGATGHLGLMGTATTSFDGGETYPPFGPGMQLCPSGDQTAVGTRCFRDSYVGGLDGLWRSPSGDYVASGAFIESFIHGGIPAIQLDGTPIGTGATGAGGWARVAKEGGRFLASAQYAGAARRLDYNDLGYMQRQNQHEVKTSIGYRTLEPGRLTFETDSALEITERRSVDGLDLGQIYELNSRLRFLNYWSAFVAADVAPPRYDDREVGDGTALERGGYAGARLDLSTDPKRRVNLDFSGTAQTIQHGATNLSVQGTLSLNLLPQLELALSPVVTRTTGEPRWAWTVPGVGMNEYVFGQLAATSVGAILRASYTFAPRVSLQTYAQGFLASGSFTDRRAVAAAPGAHITTDQIRASPLATMLPLGTAIPDFEEAALNLNVVFRWEYLPGSTLFIVYSRSQVPAVNISDMTAHLAPRVVGHGSSADVILLKLTYWWAS